MMRYRTIRTGIVLAATLLATIAFASEKPTPFKDGDRVAVVGDSITQSRRTHSYIWNFYATRFPNRRVRFDNCGISGDSAGGAVRRFDWDIAIHKPTVATIMLGMNDVGRGSYGKNKTSEKDLARQKGSIDNYRKNMDTLSQKLRAIGARIVYITPSIYDQTGTQKRENNYGVNDALGTCGDIVRKLADKYDGSVIDLHGPMTKINADGQKKDPNFTIIGPDRIHPADVGQFIMATLFLEQQGVPPIVSRTEIDAASGRIVAAERCKVSGLKTSPNTVEFTSLEESLPCYVPPATRPALKIVPFQEKLNREILQVKGLEEGNYEVVIDGTVSARATAAELAKGIDLATSRNSPMMRQARKVWEELEKRQHIVGYRLRRFAELRHHDLSKTKLDINDYDGVLAYLEKKQADLEASGNRMANYQRGKLKAYKTYKPQEAQMVADAEAALDQAYTLNKPQPHHFVVRPGTAAAAADSGEVTVDDFDAYEGWKPISWSESEPQATAKDGIVTFRVPRTPDHRDMYGVSRTANLDMMGADKMLVKMRATKGAHLTIEVRTDAGSKRIANYEKASGDWQTLSFPIEGKTLVSMNLIMCEPGKNDLKTDDGFAVYAFDRIWLAGGEAASSEAKEPEGAKVLDDFDVYEGYSKASWTNTEGDYKETGKTVVITLPRTDGKRDMYGLTRGASVDLTPYKTLNIRLKADKNAPIGVEMSVDGKNQRIASYVRTSGDWQTMSFALPSGMMRTYTLILAEGSPKEKNESPTATYEFDRIWLE